jgi:hypothetical protein
MTYLDRKRRISIDAIIDEIKRQKTDNASGSLISVVTGKHIVHYGI